MNQFISEGLEKYQKENLSRKLQVLETSKSHEIVLSGESFLNFSSNDYLGYSHHPQVIESGKKALERYGSGGRSSRLISGSLEIHRELEEKLAQFKGTESCLLFPSGFMANLGVISALLGDGDAILMDRLNHASLIDAAKLSRARLFVYKHSCMDSLETLLKRTQGHKKRLVVTDSLFSMDGDCALLPEIVSLCDRYGVWLMIDDAHATGVLGKKGIGSAEFCGVLGQVEIVMGTLSKALGSQGGFVCGSRDLIQWLIHSARPFIYTTALSPVSCATALCSLDLVQKEKEKRDQLLRFSQKLKEELHRIWEWDSLSQSQIIPFIVGSSEKTLDLSAHLKRDKIYAPAIRPPTVPKNESRIRFSLTSDHTSQDIDRLVSSLKKWIDRR